VIAAPECRRIITPFLAFVEGIHQDMTSLLLSGDFPSIRNDESAPIIMRFTALEQIMNWPFFNLLQLHEYDELIPRSN